MRLSRYRAVLFDLDGTLVDSYDALSEAINHARRAFGLTDLNRAQVHECVGEGPEILLQRMFAPDPVPDVAAGIFEEKYGEICCERSSLLADVQETLQAIAADGIQMAVCTNKPTGFSRRILEYLEVAHHFTAIAGPDLAGSRKPDPQHVLFALAPTGVSIEDALFVGDMPIDVAAARASGMDVAVIATGSSSAGVLRDAQPDYFLESFPEVLLVLRQGALAAR